MPLFSEKKKDTQKAKDGASPTTTAVALRTPAEELPVVALENNEDITEPLQDDDWIRRAQFVELEALQDPQTAMTVKEQIMRDFYATHPEMRDQIAAAHEQDPILRGMLYQEDYMQTYKQSERPNDKKKAISYKRELLETYKQRRSQSPDQARAITGGTQPRLTANNTASSTVAASAVGSPQDHQEL